MGWRKKGETGVPGEGEDIPRCGYQTHSQVATEQPLVAQISRFCTTSGCGTELSRPLGTVVLLEYKEKFFLALW